MSSVPDFPAPTPPSGMRSIFFGPSGLRAGWRLLVFFAVFLGTTALFQFLAIRFVPSVGALLLATAKQQTELTPTGLITVEFFDLLGTIVALFVMSRIERKTFADYGFRAGAGDRVIRFCEGLIWGVAVVVALCTLLKVEGHFVFGPIALSGSLALRYGLLWGIATLMVGFFEETAFRGYTQLTLASGIGFWPAAFVLSAIFGLSHLGDHGYTWLGVVSAASIGLIFCFCLRRMGSLWLGIGFHAAFDFSETFLFSPPNGGLASNTSTHLFASSISGPSWLTGGGTGVEGSVNGLVVLAVVFLVLNWIHPARKTEPT